MTIILNCDIVINTYDKAGNIETITENGKVIARYEYDGLNRLTKEKTEHFGEKTYEYDNAGNIIRKTENGKTYEYSYGQHGWRDQLLSFGETKSDIKEECTYDELGNPLSYKGRNLVWQGRRLISYGIENKKATYTYDFNNVRTSKTATDGTTSVTLNTYTTVIISLPNRELLKVPIKISPYGYTISTEWTVLQGLTLKIKSISTVRTYRVI